MIHETLTLILVLATGIFLGAIFFGGLWWTIRKGVLSKHPVLWFFGSLLLRTGIVLTGFYFIAHGHWERIFLCLLGFVTARVIVMWLTRKRSAEHQTSPAREVNHAP